MNNAVYADLLEQVIELCQKDWTPSEKEHDRCIIRDRALRAFDLRQITEDQFFKVENWLYKV